MGDIAIRRAQNLERNLSEDEKLKLEVGVTLIKNVMNLMSELRVGANTNNPAAADSQNHSNIAQDCKDTALTLWRAYHTK